VAQIGENFIVVLSVSVKNVIESFCL